MLQPGLPEDLPNSLHTAESRWQRQDHMIDGDTSHPYARSPLKHVAALLLLAPELLCSGSQSLNREEPIWQRGNTDPGRLPNQGWRYLISLGRQVLWRTQN